MLYPLTRLLCRTGALLYLMGLATNGAASGFPVELVDSRGKTVIIKKEPENVASIAAFGADLMAAFGREVVGVSSMNNKLPLYLQPRLGSTVDLGSAHETNLERLTELKPDLTIGLRTYTEPFQNQFEKIGAFLAYDFISLQDSLDAVVSSSRALGKAANGEQLNQHFLATLDAYQQHAPGGLSALFIWHWGDIPWTYYDHHMTVELMRALKVDNALGASPTPKMANPHAAVITMEQLLALNPDVILSFQSGDEPIAYHPVWQRLKAVKNNRAYRVGDHYPQVHGPIARELVLKEMAHIFYPDQFSEPEGIPDSARFKPSQFAKP